MLVLLLDFILQSHIWRHKINKDSGASHHMNSDLPGVCNCLVCMPCKTPHTLHSGMAENEGRALPSLASKALSQVSDYALWFAHLPLWAFPCPLSSLKVNYCFWVLIGSLLPWINALALLLLLILSLLLTLFSFVQCSLLFPLFYLPPPYSLWIYTDYLSTISKVSDLLVFAKPPLTVWMPSASLYPSHTADNWVLSSLVLETSEWTHIPALPSASLLGPPESLPMSPTLSVIFSGQCQLCRAVAKKGVIRKISWPTTWHW